MSRIRRWAWRRLRWIHPGLETLLRAADGLGPDGVDAHLARCTRCHEQVARIREAMGRAHSGDPALDEVFEGLQLRIRAWCSLGEIADPVGSRVSPPANRELSGALAVYFGEETARRIQRCERRDASGRALAPVARPLFTSFLGRKAAEALASRIAGAVV